MHYPISGIIPFHARNCHVHAIGAASCTSSCHSTYCISGNNLLTQSASTHTPQFTSTWTSSSCMIWLHVSIAWTTCMPRQVYRCCYFITSPADMQRSTNALYVKLVDALKMPVSSRSVWVYYNHTFMLGNNEHIPVQPYVWWQVIFKIENFKAGYNKLKK